MVVALALELAHHHLEQEGDDKGGDETSPPQIDELVVAARPQLGEVGEADADQQEGFQPLAQGNEKTYRTSGLRLRIGREGEAAGSVAPLSSPSCSRWW